MFHVNNKQTRVRFEKYFHPFNKRHSPLPPPCAKTLSSSFPETEEKPTPKMAMAYAPSSSIIFSPPHTSPYSLNNNNNNRLSPFLSFGSSTMASSPKNTVGVRSNRNFQIRCEVQQRAFAPVEQRWMFTDSDFTGPVTFFFSFSFCSSLLYFVLFRVRNWNELWSVC